MARLRHLLKYVAQMQQRIEILKGSPAKGKEMATRSHTPDESKTSASGADGKGPDREGNTPSSREEDASSPLVPRLVRDPGPSRQPGLLPDFNRFSNPKLMRRYTGRVQYRLSQAQHSPESQTSSESRDAATGPDVNEDCEGDRQEQTEAPIASSPRPRVRPSSNAEERPAWDQLLYTENTDRHNNGDCIYVSPDRADGPDVLASESEAAAHDPDSDASGETVRSPTASG